MVTSHLTAGVYGQLRAAVDRQLLQRVCARLTGPLRGPARAGIGRAPMAR